MLEIRQVEAEGGLSHCGEMSVGLDCVCDEGKCRARAHSRILAEGNANEGHREYEKYNRKSGFDNGEFPVTT